MDRDPGEPVTVAHDGSAGHRDVVDAADFVEVADADDEQQATA
jgi:hypothetical protein